MASNINLNSESAANIETPSSGRKRLFLDSTNSDHLTSKNSSGVFFDYEDTSQRVFNILKSTSGTLNAGELVYLVSQDETDNVISCELAQADSSTTMDAFAIVLTAATDLVAGTAIAAGTIGNVDTDTFTVNDTVYVSDTVAGGYTNQNLTGSSIVQAVGIVGKVDASVGTIVINVSHAIDDISDLANRIQSTGLLEGGIVSQASSTTADWTSGKGQVTDYSNPEHPLITEVTWDAVSGYTPTNIATDDTTLFAYDSDGVLVELSACCVTASDTKDYIIFGSVTHVSGSIINVIEAPGNMGYDGIGSYADFINLVIGPANITGNTYGANDSNMNIDVIGGQAYVIGSNFRNDPKISDVVTLGSESTISFAKVYRSADPGLNIEYDGAATTSIDPTQYDDGSGTLQSVTSGYFTIQRIFRSRTGDTFVAYGQEEFLDKDSAVAALGSESFKEKSPLPLTLFRSSLIVAEDATDLSVLAEAEFFEQSSFRLAGAQSSSSTIPGITNPGGSDTNVQFNDGGNFGGESDFTYNKTTDTLTVNIVDTDIITSTSFALNDETRDRIVVDADQMYYVDPANKLRIFIGEVDTLLKSPSGSKTINITDSGTVLSDPTTATTQSADDNSTKLATTAYVDTAVGVEDLWDRTGTVLSPSTAGDDITTTGSINGTTLTGDLNGTVNVATTGITENLEAITTGLDQLDPNAIQKKISIKSVNTTVIPATVSHFRNGYVEFDHPGGDIDFIFNDDVFTTGDIITIHSGDGGTVTVTQSGTGGDIAGSGASYVIAIGDGINLIYRGSNVWDMLSSTIGTYENGTLTTKLGSSIATTQSALDNSTKVATTAYVESAVSVEDLWDKTGTVLTPSNAGDNIAIDKITGLDGDLSFTLDNSYTAKLLSAGNTVYFYIGDSTDTADTKIIFKDKWQVGTDNTGGTDNEAFQIKDANGATPYFEIDDSPYMVRITDKTDNRLVIDDNTYTYSDSIGDRLTIDEFESNFENKLYVPINTTELKVPFTEVGTGVTQIDYSENAFVLNNLGTNPIIVDADDVLELDGTNYIKTATSLPQLNNWTVTTRFKTDTGGASKMLVSKDDSGYNNDFGLGLGLGSDANQISLQMQYDSAYHTLFKTETITLGQWYTVTGTYDGTIMKLYVDGVFVDSLTQSDLYVKSDQWAIGARSDNAGNKYTGNIDYVKIQSKALTAEEVELQHSSFDYSADAPNIKSDEFYVIDTDDNINLKVDTNGILGVLADGSTATTQTDGDDSTKVATTAYVDNHSGNGIWTRTGTEISPTNSGDTITSDSSITGSSINSTGIVTGTILDISDGSERLVVDGTSATMRSPNQSQSVVVTDDGVEINDITGGLTLKDGSMYQLAYANKDSQVLHYDFIELGSPTYDKSTHGLNDGTPVGSPVVNDSYGRFGNAMRFNGTSQYITTTNSSFPFSNGTRTVMAGVKTDTIVVGSGVIIEWGQHVGDDVFSVQRNGSELRVFTSADEVSSASGVFEADTWYDIAVTYDGININAWMNGKQVITNQTLTVGTQGGDITVYIGAGYDGGAQDYWDGDIEYLMVFSSDLPEEIVRTPYLFNPQSSAYSYDKFRVFNHDTGQPTLEVFNDTVSYNDHEVSTNGAEVVEVWSLDDLPAAVSGVITLEYKFYRFMQGVDFGTTQIKLENGNYVLFEAADVFVTSITYSGTDPWFIGEGSVRCVGNGLTWLLTADDAVMFDLDGGWGMDYSSIIATGTGASLGEIRAPSESGILLGTRFVSTRSLFSGFKYGLDLYNVGAVWINLTVFIDTDDAVGAMLNFHDQVNSISIEVNEVTLTSATSDFLYLSPTVTHPVHVQTTILTDGQSFFKSGDTGTFTEVADASIGVTSTSVTESSGVARFGFTGPTVYVNQEVVISGFTSNPTYNGTYIITSTDGSSYFEVSIIDYGSDETGSFLSNSVTLTDNTTTLSDGDTIFLDTDLSTAYDGGTYVYNQQTNTVQVNATWIATEIGTWDSGSLREDSKYVNSNNNGAQSNSANNASMFVSGNTATTSTTGGGTWDALNLGTALEGQSISRFKVIDAATGLMKYNGLNTDSEGVAIAISAFKSSASAVNHKFRLFKTSGSGAFDAIEPTRALTTALASISLVTSVQLNPGDEFRIEVASQGASTTVTIQDLSLTTG